MQTYEICQWFGNRERQQKLGGARQVSGRNRDEAVPMSRQQLAQSCRHHPTRGRGDAPVFHVSWLWACRRFVLVPVTVGCASRFRCRRGGSGASGLWGRARCGSRWLCIGCGDCTEGRRCDYWWGRRWPRGARDRLHSVRLGDRSPPRCTVVTALSRRRAEVP